MSERTQRRTYKWFLAFFFGFLFFQGVFASALGANAQGIDRLYPDPASSTVETPKDTTAESKGPAASEASKPTEEGCGWTTNFVTCAVQTILIAIRDLFSWVATGAATLFVWVVHPDNVSGPNGILNKPSVYNLWKFIRDFFNLFFILILLFSAFATIFQLESFSIRKIFLNILFAALIINFSFPITRFLIDLTNVPMYYFLNVAIDGTTGGALKITETFLGSSGMSAIPLGAGSSLALLLMNVIFMFLFAMSLLILSVMLLIRVIALALLLIFAPIGFAASAVPGLEHYGKDWWNYFWKYAFFGPSAALVLLIAIRFLHEVGQDGTFASIIATSTNMTAGSYAGMVVSQITFFAIPIILIWFAIGMGSKASIAGAGMVVGKTFGAAKKIGKWTGKGAWGATKMVVPVKGISTGIKEAAKSGKLFGAKLPISGKSIKQREENREAKWKGMITGGREGRDKELGKLEAKRQYEAAKEMKENNVSYSDLVKALTDVNKDSTGKVIGHKDKTKAAAAAMVLTDKKAINSAEHLDLAFKALGENTNELADLISNAGDDAFKFDTSTTAGADNFGELRKNLSDLDTKYGSKLNGKLEDKIKKEGHAKVLIDYDINSTAASAAGPVSRQAVYDKHLAKMTAKEIAKIQDVHAGPDPEVVNYVKAQTAIASGATAPNWGPKDKGDFYSELTSAQKAAWNTAGFTP